MSDIESNENDFELMQKEAKYIPPILKTDVIEGIGKIQNIIGNLFTIIGELNESIYEDAVIVNAEKQVIGHIVDIFGSYDGACNYCCARASNCENIVWDSLIDSIKCNKEVLLYAVQSLSIKLDKLEIKEKQIEDEGFFQNISEDSEEESIHSDVQSTFHFDNLTAQDYQSILDNVNKMSGVGLDQNLS
eukprot:NODE_8_length_66115_cov_0.981823.p39 type:complete len:189 gc:universal NODE_8_length_66115_cov_0.981823:56025-56591(+)